jgi:hypothetical protein
MNVRSLPWSTLALIPSELQGDFKGQGGGESC